MRDSLKINLYSDYPSGALDISGILEYLSGYGFLVKDCGNFINFLGHSEGLLNFTAQRLAGAAVDDVSSEHVSLGTPTNVQVTSEINRLNGSENPKETLYDGYLVQRIYHSFMARGDLDLAAEDVLHIVFTGRLFGTFEDRRYHARVVLTGQPALISTSGLVEAPAKPREYYFIKGGLVQSGRDIGVLDEMYKGRFVEYDDPKTTSIICSYALQAVFTELTGRAFCDNADCCLYNSHWQEEVLRVQYQGKLCDECIGLLRG